MMSLVLNQLLAVLGCIVLLGPAGWATSRLLQLQLRVPSVLLPTAAFIFGLGWWTIAAGVSLGAAWPIRVTIAIHAVVSVALVVAARLRERRRGHAKRGTDALSGWTIAAIGVAVLLTAAIRTRIAFDTLFHLGLVRRLLELDAPTYEVVDRISGGGVNPAYVLPTWQSAMAGVSAITGLDPAIVVESLGVVAVLVAACACAAFGRALTGSVAGEVAGAAGYAWLRIAFPRRELEGDGIAYAVLPGNLAIDVMLTTCLVVALLVVRRRIGDRRGDGPLLVLGSVASVLLVVLHANYLLYLAIIGVGTAMWLLAAGPWGRLTARRVWASIVAVGIPGAIALVAMLPILALLEHFGSPNDQRIDYYVVGEGWWQVTRPGHLYDWFAAPGLLAILALPWAAWRARGVARAMLAGGALLIMGFAMLPPLVQLLEASGSLTIGMRLPRPLGVLLVGVIAIVLPDLVALLRRRGRLAQVAALAAVAVASFVYGYPLARREPPQYGWDWPTIVAAAGLFVVLALGVRRRASAGRLDGGPSGGGPALRAGAVGMAALLVGICLLPSGAISLRRGGWQARELVAAYRADDLRCYDGVQAALRDIPGGDTLIADPVTGYGAQALAPVRIAADFKVWNGATDEARIDRRVQQLRATFNAKSPSRAGAGLARLSEDLDAHWLLVARDVVEPPIGSEIGTFDARGLRELLGSGRIDATRVAAGPGRMQAGATEQQRGECDLELWRLDGSERELELQRDDHHGTIEED
ncbi:MAG: hypothetical protein JWM86_620 [Thermoleophilia bacterium]|nr:hypothetical protein [Thermoleophilia bacterium]